ncbi:MAG: hypothetical protein ACYC3I_11075 [Gemmataceae bacterium]
MASTRTSWYRNHRLWLEAFVLVNLAFLAPDIYVAHSTNLFRHAAEYIPFFFSLTAPLVLLAALLDWKRQTSARVWRLLGYIVGWTASAIGIAGLIFHLESHFFHEETLESLVYAAPFAAPLAYTGIGLLLILNRMVDAESTDWPYWVLFLALGGFVGNLIFSLTDNAQNGFFYPSEWVPVASSAFAVGFLLVPFLVRVNRSFLAVCAVVMLVQAAVGLLGFYYHTSANLRGPSPNVFDNFVYGAPAMAPLLFPNLVLLTFIGLWALRRHLPVESAERGSDALPLALRQTDS